MEGLDAWITGEGLCTYCGQRKCVCEPEPEEIDMTTDRLGKLLEKVALECVGEVLDAYGLGHSTNEACERVLEARLGPLLRAGQAMRDWENEYRTLNHLGKIPPSPFQQWDAALNGEK